MQEHRNRILSSEKIYIYIYIYIYKPNRKMTTDSYAVTNHVEVWRWPIPHRSLVSHVIPRG